MSRLARSIATLGPVGSVPIAPATAASALIALVGWFVPVPPLPVTLVLIAALGALSVWSAGEAEKVLGHDAKPIVIDEVLGQSVALLFVPHSVAAFFVAFVLFRGFDVWKPFGAREAQDLPGGWGVTADDAIAGLAACGVFHAGTALLGAFGLHPW